MNDLLASVQQTENGGGRASIRRRADNPAYAGRGADIEMGAQATDFQAPPTEQEMGMQRFFTAVEAIKKDMAVIKQA